MCVCLSAYLFSPEICFQFFRSFKEGFVPLVKLFAVGGHVFPTAVGTFVINSTHVVLIQINASSLHHEIPSVISYRKFDRIVMQVPLIFPYLGARLRFGNHHCHVVAAEGRTIEAHVKRVFFLVSFLCRTCFFCHILFTPGDVNWSHFLKIHYIYIKKNLRITHNILKICT